MPRGSNNLVMPSAIELYRNSGGRDGTWGTVWSKKGKPRFAPLDLPMGFGAFSKRGMILALRVFDEMSSVLRELEGGLDICANGSTPVQRQEILRDARVKMRELDERLRPFVRAACE